MISQDQQFDKTRRKTAAEWCLRFAHGPVQLEQQIALQQWLDEDRRNFEIFQGMAAIWQAVPDVADAPELISARADALEAMRGPELKPWQKITKQYRIITAIAACLLLLTISSFHFLVDQNLVYHTEIGERRLLALDDGSKVSLDAATRIEVAFSDQRRSIRLLSGRAKFDVAKDPRRPFTVSAGGRMVLATGTAFSVELMHSRMRVILYEGNVAVLEDGPSDQPPRHIELVAKHIAADKVLEPGTMMIAALDEPLARIEPVDLRRSLSWEGGQLTFSDEPLSIAADTINRYSDKKVVIDDHAIGSLVINGAFNAGDTDAFVEGVSALYNLRVTREGIAIKLSRKNLPS